MKDNFSSNSSGYAQHRPGYPAALYTFLMTLLKTRDVAWDCATGNGQVAVDLAGYFNRVEATDISLQQMQHALMAPNVHYTRQPAENTRFPNNYFDLITVGQAVHWFNFSEFYREVRRTLKPQGVICLIGYSLFRSNKETEKIIDHFYKHTVGPYWDPERKYLDEKYETIPFPFEEIHIPHFGMKVTWSYERLLGYLKTWSAVKHFKDRNGYDPVDEISGELQSSFGEVGVVEFPLLLRVGRNE